MRPFVIPTVIRIINKQLIKKGVQNTINSMVYQSITHGRLMDVTWLWVADIECLITLVAVSFAR